jgi:hypothetical protein
MFIRIIGFIGDEYRDPKKREEALKKNDEWNKKQYKKYLKAQKLLDDVMCKEDTCTGIDP